MTEMASEMSRVIEEASKDMIDMTEERVSVIHNTDQLFYIDS